MKKFAIVDVAAGVFINRTDTGRSIPRQVILDEVDSYEEAIEIRDARRKQREDHRIASADRWHAAWARAEEYGDMARLNQLAGIRW